MTTSALHALLDANVHFDAEYAHELSNHLPMALVALHALGAPDARLEAFAAHYRPRLRPSPPPADWPTAEPWQDRFGTAHAWPIYRSLFAQWLAHEGRDSVLSQVLPALMPGCGAAAFHGLIRTANAVRVGHDGELADGLAYWAWRFQPIDVGPDRGREDDPEAVLAGLEAAFAGWRSDAGLITQRMQAAAMQPAFRLHAARLRVGEPTLPALARIAARRYAEGGNFTVLHLVTACRAMQFLLPWIDDPQPALRSFWLACAAGAASVRPAALPAPLAALPEWPEIVERALASDDEHVIKLVDACREQHRRDGWDDCRRAAARGVASP